MTSVVQFVRARAPCGLLADGRAIVYKIFFNERILLGLSSSSKGIKEFNGHSAMYRPCMCAEGVGMCNNGV